MTDLKKLILHKMFYIFVYIYCCMCVPYEIQPPHLLGNHETAPEPGF